MENEIPSDIMAAAKATYESMPLVYDGWDEDAVILCIARAILAERESLGNIVEVLKHGRADTLTGFGNGYMSACDDFLAAIRNTTTGGEP